MNNALCNNSLKPAESVWNNVQEKYRLALNNKGMEQNMSRLSKSYEGVVIDDAKTSIDEFFTEILIKNSLSLSYYIRYLTNLINFVITEWSSEADAEKIITKYLSFIQAQMSDYELAFLFYYALSERTKNKDKEYVLMVNLDKYQFLSTIPADKLLDRNHHKIYRNTIFLFLGNREIQEKTELRTKQ